MLTQHVTHWYPAILFLPIVFTVHVFLLLQQKCWDKRFKKTLRLCLRNTDPALLLSDKSTRQIWFYPCTLYLFSPSTVNLQCKWTGVCPDKLPAWTYAKQRVIVGCKHGDLRTTQHIDSVSQTSEEERKEGRNTDNRKVRFSKYALFPSSRVPVCNMPSDSQEPVCM